MAEPSAWAALAVEFRQIHSELKTIAKFSRIAPDIEIHRAPADIMSPEVHYRVSISNGLGNDFAERFNVAAAKAGIALGVTSHRDPRELWFDALFDRFQFRRLQASATVTRDGTQTEIEYEHGVFQDAVGDSAALCAIMERESLQANKPEKIRSLSLEGKLHKIDVLWLERKRTEKWYDVAIECCRQTYDALAEERSLNSLSEAVLENEIPEQVFDIAVEKKWEAKPPSASELAERHRSANLRPVRFRVQNPYLGDTSDWLDGHQQPKPSPPQIPPPVMVKFGSYEVAQGVRSKFLENISGRIAFWKAKLGELPIREEVTLLARNASAALIARQAGDAAAVQGSGSPGLGERPPQSIPIGDHIRALRLELGLTQEKLAEVTGIRERTVQRNEDGAVKPRPLTISAYNRTFSKLLQRKVVIGEMS